MIFPWVAVRIAGLSLAHDELLRPKQLLAHNAELLALTDAIERRRDRLEGMLFRYVRDHYDHWTAKTALALKRDLHANRATEASISRIAALGSQISRSDVAELTDWAEDMRRLASLQSLDEELGATTRGLTTQLMMALAKDRWFSHGLDEAAAALSARMKSERIRLSRKDSTTLLSYASRAIWKTSPFSTFMFSGHLRLGGSGGRGFELRSDQLWAEPRRELQTNFEARGPEASATGKVSLRDRARVDGAGVTFIRSTYQPSNGGYWRYDQLMRLNIEPGVAVALNELRTPLPWGRASRRLAEATGHSSGDRLIESFTRAGVLQVHPESTEASPPRTSGPDAGPPLAPLTGTLGTLRIADALPDPRLTTVIAAAVQAAGQFMVESPYYNQLRARFHRLFPEGVCTDVSAFVFEAAREFHLAGEHGSGRASVSTRRLAPITVFLQLQEQEGSLVGIVNQAHTSVGGQNLKMLHGASYDPSVIREYGAWLKQCYGGAEPVELPVCQECNALQSQPQVTARRLSWGGEIVENEGRLDIDELQLRYSTSTDGFILQTHGGEPIALVYLGGVIPSPAWGAAYALYLLSNPLVCRLPPAPAYDRAVGGLQPYDAVMIGNTILRRPGWNVPSTLFLDAMDPNPVRAARNLSRVAASTGLPMQAFLSNAPQQGFLYAKANLRKPMYVHFDNPLFADLILRMAQRSEVLRVEEALPTGKQWAAVDGSPRISEVVAEGLASA